MHTNKLMIKFRFGSSLKRIMSKYSLEAQQQTHPNVLQGKQVSGEPQSGSISNEARLKEKFLLRKVEPVRDESLEFYALYTRAQNLYFRKKTWLKAPQREKEEELARERKEGEDGVDKVKLPEQWRSEMEFEQYKAENQLVRLLYEHNTIRSEKSKAASVQEFRKYNRLISYLDSELGPYKIKQYPGNPQQDPAAFQKWFIENHPPELLQKISKVQSLLKFTPQQRRRRFRRDLDDTPDKKHYERILSNDYSALSQMDNTELHKKSLFKEMQAGGHLVLRSYVAENELEPLPPKLPLDIQEIVTTVDRWSILRTIPLIQQLAKEAQSEEQQQPKDLKQVHCPSLLPYYQTLPEFIRNNPNVKMVFRGLEYHTPGMSLSEKQKSLNYACKLVLPFNELNQEMFNKVYENKRPYPSKYDINRLVFNQDPKNIIDAYVNPKAVKQYILDRSLQQNLNDKKDLPKPSLDVEREQVDHLPVDYYDNDDGFWDSYIQKKEEKYAQTSKLHHARPYFKH